MKYCKHPCENWDCEHHPVRIPTNTEVVIEDMYGKEGCKECRTETASTQVTTKTSAV